MTENLDIDHSLSAEDEEFFQRNGYFGPITVYTPEEMDEMWRTVRRQTLDRSHAA